jgi:hypothetical protein
MLKIYALAANGRVSLFAARVKYASRLLVSGVNSQDAKKIINAFGEAKIDMKYVVKTVKRIAWVAGIDTKNWIYENENIC